MQKNTLILLRTHIIIIETYLYFKLIQRSLCTTQCHDVRSTCRQGFCNCISNTCRKLNVIGTAQPELGLFFNKKLCKVFILKGVLVEKLFCSFINPVISLQVYIYYDQYENIWRKKQNIFFPRMVSMEMAAILDFRELTKVHITSKPLLQMN